MSKNCFVIYCRLLFDFLFFVLYVLFGFLFVFFFLFCNYFAPMDSSFSLKSLVKAFVQKTNIYPA